LVKLTGNAGAPVTRGEKCHPVTGEGIIFKDEDLEFVFGHGILRGEIIVDYWDDYM
jgi:hypothetical protein